MILNHALALLSVVAGLCSLIAVGECIAKRVRVPFFVLDHMNLFSVQDKGPCLDLSLSLYWPRLCQLPLFACQLRVQAALSRVAKTGDR